VGGLQDLPDTKVKIINSLPAPIMVKNNQPRLGLDIMYDRCSPQELQELYPIYR
jgi:hypothetical protein